MISDVLSDASLQIKEYQEALPECYSPVREKIDKVTAAMDELRIFLDTPPYAPSGSHNRESGNAQ